MRTTKILQQRSAGFSLVELSIVLLIIALIAGAVTGGIAMKRNLELQNIMQDISTLTQATEQFKNIYSGLPGDLWNATEKFGDAVTINGDGDGVIAGGEGVLAFQHLSLAGLIKGAYPATWSAGSLMPGPIANSTYYFGNSLGKDPAVIFAGIGATSSDRIAVLSPQDMYKIDVKYDDGLPNAGTIRAYAGGNAVGDCITGDGYVMTNSRPACYFTVVIGKN